VSSPNDETYPFALFEASDLPHDREAERRIGRRPEAQLRERHAEFGAPSTLVAADGDVPDRIPPLIVVTVVEPVGVRFDASRIDGELIRAPPIVKRIDHHADPVRRGMVVAASSDSHDARRFRIDRLHGDVNGVVVVRDPRFGVERGLRAVVRVALPKAGDDGRLLPHRVGEISVQPNGGGRGQWLGGDARGAGSVRRQCQQQK
jgi:hypothetical protein